METRRWIGGLALAVILVLAAFVQSTLWVFWDIPSLVLTLVGGTAAWLTMSGKGVSAAIATVRAPTASAGELAASLHTIQTGRRAFWVTGGLGTLIGLVQMLQQMDDPAAIGPATAVASLTILYALLVNVFVLSPMEKSTLVRLAALQSTEATPRLNQDLAASRDALEALRQRTRATVPDGR
jgi:flagellar motor component MotA